MLCSRAARPRTVLIDDKENIAQAARAGVELIAIYSSADRLEDATQYGMLESTPELHLLSREMLRGLFTGKKHSRVFALARATHSGEVQTLDEIIQSCEGLGLTLFCFCIRCFGGLPARKSG